MYKQCTIICLSRLPKNIEIRKKWLDWICTQNGTELHTLKAYLCSYHFKPEDKWPRNLKPRAIPCIANNPETEPVPNYPCIVYNPETEPVPSALDIYEEYSSVIEVKMSHGQPCVRFFQFLSVIRLALKCTDLCLSIYIPPSP